MIEHNLFVITGVGQLRNIYGFISEYHAVDNMLIVLYTEQNVSVVKNIQSNVVDGVFREIYYLKQPLKTLNWTRQKGKTIWKAYDEQINRLKEAYGLQNLFLCNRDNYYYFFKRLTHKYGLSLNMLEEGLTTYRLFQEEWDAHHTQTSGEDLKRELKNMSKALKNFGKAFVKFFCNLFSLIFHRDLLRDLKQLAARANRYRYGIIYKFDNYYVCYPEIVQKYRPKEKTIYPLTFRTEQSEIQFVDDLNEENILFVNQKYGINYSDHFRIIFTLLYNYGIKKIYIKFHPREDKEAVFSMVDLYRPMFPGMEIRLVENADSIPVEDLLVSNNIKKVIALTSSSLFYAKLIKPDIETYSIAQEYAALCDKIEIPSRKQKTFLTDYQNIDRIFQPKQLEIPFDKVHFTGQNDAADERVMFVNEKLGLDELEQYDLVFQILTELNVKKVYLKFAMQNNLLAYCKMEEEFKAQYKELEIVPLYSLSYAESEELVKQNGITSIISITDEILYNESLKDTGVERVSIADRFIEKTNGSVRLYEKFETNYQILKEAGVKQV